MRTTRQNLSGLCLLLIPRILSPSPTWDLVDTASWVGFGSPGRLKACVRSLHALLWTADLSMTWIEKWDLFSIFDAFFRSLDREQKKRGNAGSAFASSDIPQHRNTSKLLSFQPWASLILPSPITVFYRQRVHFSARVSLALVFTIQLPIPSIVAVRSHTKWDRFLDVCTSTPIGDRLFIALDFLNARIPTSDIISSPSSHSNTPPPRRPRHSRSPSPPLHPPRH